MDLTDARWAVLEPLFRPKRRADGRGRPWQDTRAVLNGVLGFYARVLLGSKEVSLLTHRTPRSEKLVIDLCCALAGALFPIVAAAHRAQSRAPAGIPAPNGLVLVIENKPQENRLNLRA
jgi:hypothetical protein